MTMQTVPLEIIIDSIRERVSRFTLSVLAIESAQDAAGGSIEKLRPHIEAGTITEGEASDLIAYHMAIENAFEIQARLADLSREVEIAESELQSCTTKDRFAAKLKLNQLRAEQTEATFKTSFTVDQRYKRPEFFEGTIPLLIQVRRSTEPFIVSNEGVSK